MGWFLCTIKFLFRVYYSVVQSISFLFTGGGGEGSFFLLSLCKNLFRNKSVCSVFSSKISQLPFCQKSGGRLLLKRTSLVRWKKWAFGTKKFPRAFYKLARKNRSPWTSQNVAILTEKKRQFIPFQKYRKIPKISPRAYIFQKPFLRGLFLEELIFGGAYLRREMCVSKAIGLAL